MASSSEAFEKFEMWKKSKTPLKVTAIAEGLATGEFVGKVIGVDSAASQVLLSNPLVMHSAVNFDIEESEFSIETSRLVATRNESDWIVFEEVAEMLPIWSRSVR
ncbi:MAG TPA: hypothetical protein VFC39_04180 [Acidobacteriaceae bacterium]|nr:hypothetical protein [Acidobacteriaceae bacterium]